MTSREDIEEEAGKFGMKNRLEPFLDWCEEKGGQLDMRRADDVVCAIGPGDIDYSGDYEDEVEGDLAVVSYDAGFPRLTVQTWGDGEQIMNTFLEDVRIDEEGKLHGELGDVSGLTTFSGWKDE